jgi:disulfide bond formation protein DsbB
MYMTPEHTAIFTLLNNNLSIITLLGFVVVLIMFVDVVALGSGFWKGSRSMYVWLAKYALPVGFSLTAISTAVSLYYSDVLGVLPCGLCWFQRVFIYSMMVILGAALWKKDRNVWSYINVLAIPGLLIALYHEYLQLGYSELIPCPAIASTVDCAKPTFLEYGFVTYPFMSVVLFTALLLISWVVKKYSK